MKKLVSIAAAVALSACSQEAEEAAPVPAETTTAAMPANADPTGTYDVRMPDGTMGRTTINADGTYVDVSADGTEERGTFTRDNDQDCFDPDGDAPAMCWTVSPPSADGSFTATSSDGTTTVTVTRAADGAAAAPTPAAT